MYDLLLKKKYKPSLRLILFILQVLYLSFINKYMKHYIKLVVYKVKNVIWYKLWSH